MKKLANSPTSKRGAYDHPPPPPGRERPIISITIPQEPFCKWYEIYQHIIKNMMIGIRLLMSQ